MKNIYISTGIRKLIQLFKGSSVEFDLSGYQQTLYEINRLKPEIAKKNGAQLKEISTTLINKARKAGNPDDLLVEAFALVREAIFRTLNLQPFDVQIIGGMVINEGKLAEMQTGEGKTLTAVFPAYLNALTGNGVHILTFNDYLARRDAEWMRPVYEFLGLSVGYVQEGMSIEERKNAYNRDITYLTAKEAGFDYLRDCICYDTEDIVHREFNYTIVDEADSIMIDEARIPLVIAGATEDHVVHAAKMAEITRNLNEHELEFDEYSRNVQLSSSGIKKVERKLKCGNLHDGKNYDILTRLNCALHAEYLLHNDVDYIIRNGQVELVDEFTGRVAYKRRWPDGLQAAIEAKEGISVQSKGKILNSITLQHFLQRYPKLSGMTATAQISEDEFTRFYNLKIVQLPPNKPCIRNDSPDLIFATRKAKNKALIDEIKNARKTGRPVLAGTRTVEESALLADSLEKENINCMVLNAKRDAYEAKIVAKAGLPGAVTISTNMAGRGTDIRLGAGNEELKKQAASLGGLYIIGTNRHESRRIDNQLRGRSGRQGDPGSSQYFISLEDDLFVKYNIKELFPQTLIQADENGAINNPIITREVNRIQRIIEGQNLEIKKTLFKYSSLIERQREVIFDKRSKILSENFASGFFMSKSPDHFENLKAALGIEEINRAAGYIFLNHIDRSWSQYLAEIEDIREGIHMTRLGGKDPFFEFQKLSVDLFDKMLTGLESEVIKTFNNLKITENRIDFESAGIKAPSSTWTYLVNDNSFENNLGVQLIGNMGLSIGAGIFGPLMVVFHTYKKLSRKDSVD